MSITATHAAAGLCPFQLYVCPIVPVHRAGARGARTGIVFENSCMIEYGFEIHEFYV